MILIQNLTKSYNETPALNGISLEIHEREFFGLLGPNGAGKSTMLNILVGYLQADGGSVNIAGHDMMRKPIEARRQIGFVPQEIALYGTLNALENLEFFGSLFGLSRKQTTERAKDLLNAVGLWDRRKDKVELFSGGMKRRLNIITSIMHNPPIVLCDEPTAGVDPQSRNAIFEFLETMHDRGTTIIYTTHYMEEAERLCSRIGIIDHGKFIALGSLDELLTLAPDKPSISVVLSDDQFIDEGSLSEFGTVAQSDGKLTITPHSSAMKLSALLQRMEQMGISYQDVRFDRPTLESLFLHLTGRRLRE